MAAADGGVEDHLLGLVLPWGAGFATGLLVAAAHKPFRSWALAYVVAVAVILLVGAVVMVPGALPVRLDLLVRLGYLLVGGLTSLSLVVLLGRWLDPPERSG